MPIRQSKPNQPPPDLTHKAPAKPVRTGGSSTMPAAGPGTRERILIYLQENRLVSVQTLSRDWGLTRADIRYHLNALIEEDIIELVPRDPSGPARRGRPTQQYRLATTSAPDNLPSLCSALLDVLLSQPDEAVQSEQVSQSETLQAVAEIMAGDAAASSMNTGDAPVAGTPTQRFTRAVAYLNQHGYRARWEAHASGPRLLLRACPYAALLLRHPELCALDQRLLEQLVRLPLSQAARMNFVTGRPPACIFSSR